MKEWLEARIFINPEWIIPRYIPLLFLRFLEDNIETLHYFHEPNHEIRFRIYASKVVCNQVKQTIKAFKGTLWFKKVRFRRYKGEEKLYGKKGFDIAKDYFESGSLLALRLLNEDTEKSLDFHARRYTHLFLNQLGLTTWEEFKWAVKYAWYRLKVWFLYKVVWRYKGR